MQAIFAQGTLLQSEIGDFSNAFAFSINPQGFIYISDISTNEIYKLDTLGNTKKFIGGYGWDASSFSDPVDIFATTLNIFVADKNNNRIQIFDKDLNFLSEFNTRESDNPVNSFAYPTCIANSTMGDMFILDSDNSRILKYNLSGDFLQEIGSYDAGDFALSHPKKFAVSQNGNIYTIDGNTIFVFDQYGNGLNKFNLPIDPSNVNITFNFMCLSGENSVQIFNLSKPSLPPVTIDLSDQIGEAEIREAIFVNHKLYILLPEVIQIYKIN